VRSLSSDRVAARLLAGLLFTFAVLLGWNALVRLDWGLWFGAVFFAGLGLVALILGGDS
jgi:hypothetical protein